MRRYHDANGCEICGLARTTLVPVVATISQEDAQRLVRENRIFKRSCNELLEKLSRSEDEAARLRDQNRKLEEGLGRERARQARPSK